MNKITIGISSCLLGEKVRYDEGHKHDRYITDTLGQFFDYVPVCPEVEYGLPVPREAMHLAGDVDNPRLVTVRTGVDHTEGMKKWAENKLEELARQELSGYIFKSKSPSSGMRGVKVYAGSAPPVHRGVGIFAAAFMNRFPLTPVEDEGRLHDPGLRENFIERVFVFARWREFAEKGGSKDLIEFHSRHKLLIMAHSPKHLSALGKLVSGKRGFGPDVRSLYIEMLMEGLRLIATIRKNTNVLHHIMGYFKKDLSGVEKKELLDIIDRYHRGLIPLVVPVTLLNHYVLNYDEPYLKGQYYLNPHPVELMLRNHV
ncbi:MAG: DUF523 and DUF1722 domain-containing protein [Syntrophorhabdaceae bacterium]|nr:DUF523 and DUF1722 domain-containing protein [Syntrophorhabdaceae bacterium]